MPDRLVAPSILSADFARLGAHVDEVLAAGATLIHVDVMDGHFVPSITLGPAILSALREHVGDEIDLDVHLMVERPERQVADFVSAGATGITIHAESTPHVLYALDEIRKGGCRAGLAVCPATPLGIYADVAVDQALCMTVNPGWGGQAFIQSSPDKIRRLRTLIGADVPLMVDGGVGVKTAGVCVEAGADWLVAGSAVFGADDPGRAIEALRGRARSAMSG